MTVQQRNAELVNLLSADFQRRYEPNYAWQHAVSAHLALPGLRGFWPMSSFNEAGAAYDLSGQGRTLTYNGNPQYYVLATALRPCIWLDGVGDFLSRGDEAGLDIIGNESYVAVASRGLTVGMWAKFDNAATASETLISKYAAGGNQRAWRLLRLAAGTIRFVISTDGINTVNTTTATAVGVNVWTHIVGRFVPGVSSDVFVNGVKTSTLAGIPATLFNSNAALQLGATAGVDLLTGSESMAFLCAMQLHDALIRQVYEQTRAMYGV